MGLDAGTPPGLWERVRTIASEEVAKFARSGFLRNASITDGGLTIRGGFLAMMSGAVQVLYAGPGASAITNGTDEQVFLLYRRDGTLAVALFDPTGAADGSVDQEFLLFDRAGNQIFGADVVTGQGLARPLMPIMFYPAMFGGATSTTSTSFTTIWRSTSYKQQPQVVVGMSATTTGTTGEVRLLANGSQLGATQPVTTAGGSYLIGPLPVPGGHISTLTLEIQARCTGAGTINAIPYLATGYPS